MNVLPQTPVERQWQRQVVSGARVTDSHEQAQPQATIVVTHAGWTPLPLPRCRAAGREGGAALVEWLIVAPLTLLLVLGIIQEGFIMIAKSSVNYATFEAARAGSMKNAQMSAIQSAFIQALVPFYGGGQHPAQLAQSLVTATQDVAVSGTVIRILNPTKESFDDFGVKENGVEQIPNDNLAYRVRTPGTTSGQSIQDANLLKVYVTYGYRLAIPLVDRTITAVLGAIDPANALYYDNGRIPIAAQATVRMQSPAYRQASLVSRPGTGNGGAPGGNGGVHPNPNPVPGPGGETPAPEPGSPGDPGCGRDYCCLQQQDMMPVTLG